MYRRILMRATLDLLSPSLGEANWLSYPIGARPWVPRLRKKTKSFSQKPTLGRLQKNRWISANFQYFFMRISASNRKFYGDQSPIFIKANRFQTGLQTGSKLGQFQTGSEPVCEPVFGNHVTISVSQEKSSVNKNFCFLRHRLIPPRSKVL